MPQIYTRVFVQILDSSIAQDYQVRHVFEDVLKLIDRDGVLDITKEAFSRRTNIPMDIVERAFQALTSPDKNSRDEAEDGRRLIPIDPRRDWGWRVVNHQKYDAIRNKADLAARQARWREKKQLPLSTLSPSEETNPDLNPDINHRGVTDSNAAVTPVCYGGRFKKPSVDEVRFSMIKAGLPESEAQKFINYYEANGWRVGKNPMRSWQHAVGNWASNYRERNHKPTEATREPNKTKIEAKVLLS